MPQTSNIAETATIVGGCFWCTEAIFKRLKGVISVTSGYTGGKTENPTYEEVSNGNTGHAEAIQIEFDPKIISFKHILDIFWVIHDPTTLNQQGPDTGTQYRSVIFYHNNEQKELAEKSKIEMEKSKTYDKKLVTEIVPFEKFYTAEEYHQNYYERNKQSLRSGDLKNSNQYCSLVIDPKIQKLLHKFNSDVKEEYRE